MGAYGRVRPGRFVPPAERAFTRECLSATGAEEFSGKRFAELSGGQKQRVLIARALTTRPDILVLDEPTAGVDRNATHAVMEFISQIRKERKITVLLVTHDFAAVRRHAEQVIWLHEGAVYHGAAHELLSPERMAEMFERGTTDMETLYQILSPDFLLRNSVYTSVLVGFACPLVGVFLVMRRLVFMGVALPQISSTGVAIALSLPLWFGFKLADHGTQVHPCARLCRLDHLLSDRNSCAGVSGTKRASDNPKAASALLMSWQPHLGILLLSKNPYGEIGWLDMLKGEVITISNFDLVLTAATSHTRFSSACAVSSRSCSWSRSTARWQLYFAKTSFFGTCCFIY